MYKPTKSCVICGQETDCFFPSLNCYSHWQCKKKARDKLVEIHLELLDKKAQTRLSNEYYQKSSSLSVAHKLASSDLR